NAFETHEDCRAACVNETARVCSLPPVQGPCKAWETRWSYNPLGKRCATFLYGGCEGNGNSFASRSACERACPLTSGTSVCRPCRTKNKIVPSFCRSDFAIVGRMLEVVDDGTDAGLVRFTVDEVLKDDKMGLKAFNIKLLEITMLQVDWGCPCPNITSAEAGPLLVMGEVQEGIAVLYPDSYVRAVSERRARKLYEVVDRKTCDLLQRFH
uniref:BPTI/Kunitz inhibitor domain-containing protein n=1 Tax=Petromyzon marinus TaxID=7757 RepID=S4RSN3_PETMA